MFQEDKSIGVGLTPTIEPWRQDLLDAADRIRKNGLCQGAISDGTRQCTLGAIYDSHDRSLYPHRGDRYWEAATKFSNHIAPGALDPIGAICMWNNNNFNTAMEVITTLEACARK